jgi:hypothetical protein
MSMTTMKPGKARKMEIQMCFVAIPSQKDEEEE